MFEFIKKLTDNFKSADMSISGNMKVGSLQNEFKSNFGLYLRVYKGNRFANPDITLAKLNKSTSAKIDTTAEGILVKASMKAGGIEDLFMEKFGLKVQIAELYNRHLVSDNYTLGENSRRKGEEIHCEEKYGMNSMDYIKSHGFDDLESWVKHKYACSKLGNATFTGKMRGVFSLNYPHLYIKVDDGKIDEDITLKEINKLSETIELNKEITGQLSVKDFEKKMKALLNTNVEVMYQKKAKAHYKNITEIDSKMTLNEAEKLGNKEKWSDWTDWGLKRAIKYN